MVTASGLEWSRPQPVEFSWCAGRLVKCARAPVASTESASVPQRLSCLEGMRDALLRLALAAQGNERFALQIQKILLADELRRGELAAGQNVPQLARDLGVIFGNISAAQHHVHRQLGRGAEFLAEHANG